MLNFFLAVSALTAALCSDVLACFSTVDLICELLSQRPQIFETNVNAADSSDKWKH